MPQGEIPTPKSTEQEGAAAGSVNECLQYNCFVVEEPFGPHFRMAHAAQLHAWNGRAAKSHAADPTGV
ncbi:hypothetical protein Ancab_013236 [Ancistrocladus abbreviatus]